MKKILLLFTLLFITLSCYSAITVTEAFNLTNHSTPYGSGGRDVLTADGLGNFYGASIGGGSNLLGGSIFRIGEDGNASLIHSFSSTNSGNGNGSAPRTGVTLVNNDTLYGVTVYTDGVGTGNGVLYKCTTNGNYTPLIFFNGTNGTAPWCRPLFYSNKLYVTTSAGGTFGKGTFIICDTNGSISWSTNFNGTNGYNPKCGVILGNDGWIYGTTENGGNNSSLAGNLFRIKPDGSGFTNLYIWTSNGANPSSELIYGLDGKLYGTTTFVNTHQAGTIYSYSTNTGYQLVYSFPANESNGGEPIGRLFLDENGWMYGSCAEGGTSDAGTLFCIDTNGTFILLKQLSGTTNEPSYPQGLTKGLDQNYYYSSYPMSRIARVSIPQKPVITSLTRLDCDSLQVGFKSVRGQIYEGISKDNLLTTNYTSLGLVTASGSLTSINDTNNIHLAPFRTYIVKITDVPTNSPNYAPNVFNSNPNIPPLSKYWFHCTNDVGITNNSGSGGTNGPPMP